MIAGLPGWFWPEDIALFRWFLSTQVAAGERGDIAELGVYLGKTAVLLADYLQDGEALTLVDLFEDAAHDNANQHENNRTYKGLSRSRFERYYLSVHPELPTVVQGFSHDITKHARSRGHRFVHIDASHLYEHVRADLAASRELAATSGVIAFDDMLSMHTPGTHAAVWQAVTTEGLQALLIGQTKLYAAWSGAELWRERLAAWLPSSGLGWEAQEIAGQRVFRVGGELAKPPSRSREILKGLAPPLLAQSARRARARLPLTRPSSR